MTNDEREAVLGITEAIASLPTADEIKEHFRGRIPARWNACPLEFRFKIAMLAIRSLKHESTMSTELDKGESIIGACYADGTSDCANCKRPALTPPQTGEVTEEMIQAMWDAFPINMGGDSTELDNAYKAIYLAARPLDDNFNLRTDFLKVKGYDESHEQTKRENTALLEVARRAGDVLQTAVFSLVNIEKHAQNSNQVVREVMALLPLISEALAALEGKEK